MPRLPRRLTIAFIFLMSFAFGQSKESKDSQSEWKEFRFADDGFAIKLPRAPKQTDVANGRQYRLYWNESWDADGAVELNLIVNSLPTDSVAWLANMRKMLSESPRVPWPVSVLPSPPGGVRWSSYEVVVDGNPAIESDAPRNALQAGYQRMQCLNNRVYSFEAGFPKGSDRPKIIDQVLKSFHVGTTHSK